MNNLRDAALCAGFAVFFSVARTLADNRDTGARGKALLWLLAVNSVTGLAGGLLAPALGDAGNLTLEWRVIAAAVIGWTGLASTMKTLETITKRRLDACDPQNRDRPADSDHRAPDGPGPV